MQQKKEFIKAIKENEGIIFKVTSIYCANKEDQKDLYQEIVYQLWKSFPLFRNESKITTWMYRVALNTSITHLKKEKRNGTKLELDELVEYKIEHKNTLIEERIQILYAHIKNLNTIEKGIILLYLEGKSYDEIASITGFSNTNIGTRIGRIKQKLKSEIKK
tara:strand:+ start:75334 stop:75819 length:486 start_codon:yes stop_codon:yes gene_type:complete